MKKTPPEPKWTPKDSEAHYHLQQWGGDLFSINADGELTVCLTRDGHRREIGLAEMARQFASEGTRTPLLLRFPDILAERIEKLSHGFNDAIKKAGGSRPYRGLFPIKVNQQRQVIEHIAAAGEQFHFGFEVGTKPELVIAIAQLSSGDRFLVCNGYKDAQYVDLALQASRVGIQVVLVVERLAEVSLIMERSRELGVRPRLGLRTRLTSATSGHWSSTAGEQSLFGLGIRDMVAAIDMLRAADMLNCLEMLHYHQGSQIPDIRSIETTAREAGQIYASLVREGAPMGLLNVGGGLAVDYDGSNTTSGSSRNYDLQIYTETIVGTILRQLDHEEIEHPILLSESGRAIAAPYSVLVFDIIGSNSTADMPQPAQEDAEMPEEIDELSALADSIDPDEIRQTLNRAKQIVQRIYDRFNDGQVSIRVRAIAEYHFSRLRSALVEAGNAAGTQAHLSLALAGESATTYYGNFSVFQSLPDSWAINQLFPIIPLQRLHEQPTEEVVIADITCDCDGRIKRYIDPHDDPTSITVPALRPNEPYFVGAFLVGAYQETLGDLHNLLGYPHTVAVRLDDDGDLQHETILGDKICDVLSYVEYEPNDILEKFRNRVTAADTGLSDTDAAKIVRECAQALESYTYLQQAN